MIPKIFVGWLNRLKVLMVEDSYIVTQHVELSECISKLNMPDVMEMSECSQPIPRHSGTGSFCGNLDGTSHFKIYCPRGLKLPMPLKLERVRWII